MISAKFESMISGNALSFVSLTTAEIQNQFFKNFSEWTKGSVARMCETDVND